GICSLCSYLLCVCVLPCLLCRRPASYGYLICLCFSPAFRRRDTKPPLASEPAPSASIEMHRQPRAPRHPHLPPSNAETFPPIRACLRDSGLQTLRRW